MMDSKHFSLVFLVIALSSSMTGIACASHHHYRVYDAYYTDYHEWNDTEIVYYRQWCNETHRRPGRDFRRLPPQEQKEYWNWRHNHGDRDRGRDHRDNDHRENDHHN